MHNLSLVHADNTLSIFNNDVSVWYSCANGKILRAVTTVKTSNIYKIRGVFRIIYTAVWTEWKERCVWEGLLYTLVCFSILMQIHDLTQKLMTNGRISISRLSISNFSAVTCPLLFLMVFTYFNYYVMLVHVDTMRTSYTVLKCLAISYIYVLFDCICVLVGNKTEYFWTY